MYLTWDLYIISVLRYLCLTYYHIFLWLGVLAEAPHALVSSPNFNSSYDKNSSIFSDIFVFIFFRQFIFKVSYSRCISSIVLITWVNNVIVILLGPKDNPWTRWSICMSCHLLWFNLLLSVTIVHVQSHASMYRLNWFPLLTWPN